MPKGQNGRIYELKNRQRKRMERKVYRLGNTMKAEKSKPTNLMNKTVTKWWFYLIIVLLFFMIPSYTQKGASYQESQNIIKEVLTNPLIYSFTPLFWISKAAFVLLVLLLIFQGEKMPRILASIIAVFYFGIAVFQNTAQTNSFGFAMLSGNVVLMLVVAISWIVEAINPKSDFSSVRVPLWKWWVLPLAVLAFWFPTDASGTTPQFTLTNLVSNGSMLTFCMMTPVVLGILTIFYPRVNIITMRVTSFVGTMFGVTNEVEWFILNPSMWWMGILHIPLITISLYAFAITFSTAHT
jgi:hypothetical protein